MNDSGGFPYEAAFSRNLGWVTESEQSALKASRIAIAGMGGVGGLHLLTLTRLGIGQFHVADLDVFEWVNFNRQAGATRSTLGRPKVEVMAQQALDINPDLQIRLFTAGVNPGNLDEFLDDVDVYVDGLDFFAFDIREQMFAACRAKGIPAITVAPLGMGASLLVFLPGGMSFPDYFQWQGCSELEKAIRFLVGLGPALLHRTYLADASHVNLGARKGPSTAMACQLCAGVAGTEVLKLLLRRGSVRAAPHGYHFDAYRHRLSHTWRPGGNRNPLNRLAIAIAKHRLGLT